jgi:hypothetical protein
VRTDGKPPWVAQRQTVFGVTFKSRASSPEESNVSSGGGASIARKRARPRDVRERFPLPRWLRRSCSRRRCSLERESRPISVRSVVPNRAIPDGTARPGERRTWAGHRPPACPRLGRRLMESSFASPLLNRTRRGRNRQASRHPRSNATVPGRTGRGRRGREICDRPRRR